MKTLRNGLMCVLLLAGLVVPVATLRAAVNPKPFVVPELKEWQGAEGMRSLSGRILVKHSQLAGVARDLATDYELLTGRKLTVARGSARDGDVVLSLTRDDELGKEGYRLSIGRHVEIAAATVTGAYWATRTLLQLSEQDAEGALPCGTVTDVPEYALRGFMMDCGRKFIPMSYLRNLVKMMAYYKMNTLQIHLNDNGFRQFFDNDWMKTQAAFRLECDTYPGLTAKDGSYTKQEFVELQELAARCGVEIIPEIDVPAHSLAFTQYKPELGSAEYGMDHLDLFNPEVYTFVDALFAEYLEGKQPVFRGPRVHIGTDEYSNAKKEVVEQFRAFTDHYIRLVERYGKQAVVWGALTHAQGETLVKADGVLMDCWYNGYADPRAMKEQGYRLVSIPDGLVYIVPAAGYYYDYLNCHYLYEHWTPARIGNEQFEENDPAIEGGMFAVWNDHVGNGITVKDIHHRLFPALQTLAVKCWTGKHTSTAYETFDRLRSRLSEAPGVNERALWGCPGSEVLHLDVLSAGQTQEVEEVGYDYAVSFTLEAEKETAGTELLRSSHAVFYLADHKEGKLGFAREGYLNTFNYRLTPGQKVQLTIEGTSKATRLYVDGKLKEELGPLALYVMKETDKVHFQQPEASPYEPAVYLPKSRINYQRTLVFPLREAGAFNSRVTDFKVVMK